MAEKKTTGTTKRSEPKKARSAPRKAAGVKKTAAKPVARKPTVAKRPSHKKRDICFVMSPFGEWQDRYYTDVYCPAIEAAGLEPHRADDLYRPSAIVQDIWAYVKSSRVMLADLTEKNANVFYELGLAHALDKPVVLLSQSMDDVPFDLRALRVLTYEIEDPSWGDNLRDRITAALSEVLNAPATAVLQPFNRDQARRVDTPEDEQNPMIRTLMREINLLRAEVTRAPRERDIGPTEARRLIRRYVAQGLPTSMIMDRVAALGPPVSWLREEIRRAQRETEQTLIDLDEAD